MPRVDVLEVDDGVPRVVVPGGGLGGGAMYDVH